MMYSSQTFGFHLVNALLHSMASLLMVYLVRSELQFNYELSLLSGLLFATHPIHCEAISSIVGRADVLCCIFYLVSFLAFAKSLHCVVVNKRMIFLLTVCQITSILALLSKEQGITVLGASIVYFLIIRWNSLQMPLKNVSSTSMRESVSQANKVWLYSPLISVVITLMVSLWYRIALLGGTLPIFSEQDNPVSFANSAMSRFLTYSYLSSFNARLLLLPSTLSYDWQMGSIKQITSISDTRNIFSLILFTILFAILWKIYQSLTLSRVDHQSQLYYRKVCIGLTLLIMPYIPASNLFITVGFVVAERVLYIPSIGMIILVCIGYQRITHSTHIFAKKLTPIIRSVLFGLIIIFTIKTVRQNKSWMSREALFESGLRSLPQNAKTHYNYANLQKDLGNIELAMKHYTNALSLWPDHASAHNNLGTLFCELSETESAEKHFKAALAINPFHPRAHFNLANIYSKQGLTSKAISLLKKAIELDDEFAEPYSALASLYGQIGCNEEAERLHLQALRLDSENADFCNNFGAFLQKLGRSDEAIKQYLKAIDIQPNHTIALVNAARTLKSMKHTKKAEILYKRALAVQEDPLILDNLGVLYISWSKLLEAKQIYEILNQKYPDYGEGKIHYAQLLIQQKNFSRAEQMLYSVINTNSSHRDAYHQLAILYSQVNKTTEALDYIVKALTLCSPDDITCAHLYVEHGDILRDLRDWQSAAESYRIAISLDSSISRSHLNLAVICHLEGDYNTALHHYFQAHSLDPNNPIILDNISKLKRQLYRQKYYNNGCHRVSQSCPVVR
ncbi:protein O-mannosyl-transferase TMTC1-like isoform X2 [Oppia nitens]|nr:protein O-mannosyl-transferase TMTC1-like isoform X2 [Oppia nitens]